MRVRWNFDMHRVIAEAAQRHLESSADSWLRIALFLRDAAGSASLADLSSWADEVRDGWPGRYAGDADTRCFLKTFGNTARWHYVDLPAAVDRYDERRFPRFTRRPNIVSACTDALRALQSPAQRLTRVNALRCLVHFVADLHQPLHVGCAHVVRRRRRAHLVFDPRRAARGPSDAGGTLLILPNGIDLHTYWDRALGHMLVTASPQPDRLAELVADMAATLDAQPERCAPAEWTADSLAAAREAYRHLTIVGIRPGRPVRYRLAWGQGGETEYIERTQPVFVRQLALAATRLADSLAAAFRESHSVELSGADGR